MKLGPFVINVRLYESAAMRRERALGLKAAIVRLGRSVLTPPPCGNAECIERHARITAGINIAQAYASIAAKEAREW